MLFLLNGQFRIQIQLIFPSVFIGYGLKTGSGFYLSLFFFIDLLTDQYSFPHACNHRLRQLVSPWFFIGYWILNQGCISMPALFVFSPLRIDSEPLKKVGFQFKDKPTLRPNHGVPWYSHTLWYLSSRWSKPSVRPSLMRSAARITATPERFTTPS